MHLRSLRLRGFKSFPDALELKLEPGVSVVVGPNGSGKSNVADAIVWAAGSLTPSELRADKPDDVLFNGAEGRKPAESCEVELVFDNEDGGFGPALDGTQLDFSEISIARRLHRGGEGQYLVNRAHVRRTDLVELLADVGLSGSMHSIVSQGKVEAVLASKPEERRELVEEAAGLGKFKRRKHRAELKLNRVAIQVERARDVEAEVRKRLRPLALQATAAERAEKLAVELAGLRARIAEIDLAAAEARRAEAEERKTASGIARQAAQERLRTLLAERQECRGGARRCRGPARGGGQGDVPAAVGERAPGAPAGGSRRPAPAAPRGDAAEAEAASIEVHRTSGFAPPSRQLPRQRRRLATAAAASGIGAERARAAQERLAALERGAAARAEERFGALAAERRGLEAELADVAGGREGVTGALYRLGSARERIELRTGVVRRPARSLSDRARRGGGARPPARPDPARARARRERGGGRGADGGACP